MRCNKCRKTTYGVVHSPKKTHKDMCIPCYYGGKVSGLGTAVGSTSTKTVYGKKKTKAW